jgi:hydrogenase expression/formation protein HypE
MSHGAGGRAMAQLIEELFARPSTTNGCARATTAPCCRAQAGGRMVMATDSHVVSPLFFPGGDIGCLSVHGTINDVAMMGAKPLYLSAGFILEEGFPLADLAAHRRKHGAAAREAGVPVVTGDTKVVERGKGDGVFITTTGVGVCPTAWNSPATSARPGDAILVSGTLGDHGMAIMSQAREPGLRVEPRLRHRRAAWPGGGDAGGSGADIHVLRDPTRGGLATTLNEIAQQSGVGMMLRGAHAGEARRRGRLRIPRARSALCRQRGQADRDLRAEHAEIMLAAMRAHPLGTRAAIIGEVVTPTPTISCR